MARSTVRRTAFTPWMIPAVHRQVNGGPSTAPQSALRFAQGSLIARLDHDDLWAAEMLATQIAALEPDERALGGVRSLIASSIPQRKWHLRSSGEWHGPKPPIALAGDADVQPAILAKVALASTEAQFSDGDFLFVAGR